MILAALITVLVLFGLLFLWTALRSLRQRRVAGGLTSGLFALALLSLAVGALLLGEDIGTYRRVSAEQAAGEIKFSRVDKHQFNGVLVYPTGEHETFTLRGDEWQIDARILKWRAFVNLVGIDAAYRLERISGRYSRVEDERTEPRTVYALHPRDQIDLWDLLHVWHAWLPWVDALYGSAAYLPMADGARYEIKVSQSGLLARPLNQAARDAVGAWR